MAAAAQADPVGCYHCGLPIPTGKPVFGKVKGVQWPMCCVGCCAVAEMLDAAGLADWYSYREGPSGRAAALPDDVVGRVGFLGSEALEDEYVDRESGDQVSASLLVDDLRCAACVWVIERHVGGLAAVASVQVSLATHRVRVEWDPMRLNLRDLIERLAEIGFAARPDRPGAEDERQIRENRSALIRLGVAGLGAMNVMTYSVALYVGAFDGIGEGATALMRWMGWIVSTPIVLVSARPFFVGAWRDLSLRRPGMDVPVSLAIGGAYLVSAVATYSGTGEVYFDSVCMFTFFLSLGRYLELRIRHRSASSIRKMIEGAPVMARLLKPDERGGEGDERVIPVRAVSEGDRLRIRVGEVVPVDGLILRGTSAVDESLLTGEAWPRTVSAGDTVVAGSQNVDQALTIEAHRVGSQTTLAAIVALVERASSERAPIARLADRIAAYFVSSVLFVAFVNFLVWQWVDPERAIWTTLSVLVATCPCALSLATPAAMSAASQGLAQAGFLIANPRVLEMLARVDRFVFDKTGTLTLGTPQIENVATRKGVSEFSVLEIARQLEQDSSHPIARAFRVRNAPELSGERSFGQAKLGDAADLISVPGKGIEGWIEGRRYRIGRSDWALGGPDQCESWAPEPSEEFVWVCLSDDDGPLAYFGLSDSLRHNTPEALEALRKRGVELEMLSGDPSPLAARLADRLGLHIDQLGATPETKLARVLSLQEQGLKVAVVGDGVNDGPALSAGDISISMGTGTDLTRMNADAVLLRDDLSLLPIALDWSHRTKKIISQNLLWAAGYNLLALPLAVCGVLTPWMAALGMSASSLLVTLNALRLRKAPVSR